MQKSPIEAKEGAIQTGSSCFANAPYAKQPGAEGGRKNSSVNHIKNLCVGTNNADL